MPHFDKHFTVNEANALIPRIREIFFQINALIEETRQTSTLLSLNPENLTPGRTNGRAMNQKKSKEEVLKQINSLISEITDQGIVVQDITRGLVDFPAFIDKEEVFLCYELADGDTVQYWHELNAGYAGRNPLPDQL